MQSLKLDFLHPSHAALAAWALLAAGLGLATWVGWKDRQTQHALDVAVATAPTPVADAARRPASARAGEEQTVALQARRSWPCRGASCSCAWKPTSQGIALVALEADARKAEATLTAEARTAKDMLAWIEQLKAKPVSRQ